MRFASPAHVVAWADKAALGDYAKHVQYGVDMNPYCTAGARNDWQRGYDGCGPRGYMLPMGVDYDLQYQRGAAMRRIVDSKS